MFSPAQPAPPVQTAEYAVLHGARAVRDSAFLPLARLAADGGWIVASVSPSRRSGSSTLPGAYIDGETGRFVTPPDARLTLIKEGRWLAVASSDGQPGEGLYSWGEPLEIQKTVTAEDLYSPFAHGGTVLFRRGDGGNAGGFDDVSLIFPEWGAQIGQAVTFARERPKLFQPGAWSEQEIQSARNLLQDRNEIVAVMTFRGLVERRHLDRALLRTTLEGAGGRRRAISIYAAIASSPHRSTPLLTDEIVEVLGSARTAEELEPAALAACAAFIFEPRPPFVVRRARAIVRAITSCLAHLNVVPAADSRLAHLLKRLEPPPEKR